MYLELIALVHPLHASLGTLTNLTIPDSNGLQWLSLAATTSTTGIDYLKLAAKDLVGAKEIIVLDGTMNRRYFLHMINLLYPVLRQLQMPSYDVRASSIPAVLKSSRPHKRHTFCLDCILEIVRWLIFCYTSAIPLIDQSRREIDTRTSISAESWVRRRHSKEERHPLELSPSVRSNIDRVLDATSFHGCIFKITVLWLICVDDQL